MHVGFRPLLFAALLVPSLTTAQTQETGVRGTLKRFDDAFIAKDLPGLKALLASDIVLYEHDIRNIGLDDVWEHHLRPETEAYEGTKAAFTDVRVWVEGALALVTRPYSIRATIRGQPIDARGNETIAWRKRGGTWQVAHLHYSHPCSRPPGA